jgi:hypothetical protein
MLPDAIVYRQGVQESMHLLPITCLFCYYDLLLDIHDC